MNRKFVLLITSLVLVPAVCMGSGFSLYENGGRALGMAGAATASVSDATGIFFNPAGLASLERGEILGGVSLIFVKQKFAGVNPYPGNGVIEESPDAIFTPVHLFWGHPLSQAWSVGFGVYTPYGLSTEWENKDTFTGRFISTFASVMPFYFNPVAAWEPRKGLRLGGGLMAVHSSVKLERNVGIPSPAGPSPDVLDMGTVVLEGSNTLDFGVNVGIQWDVASKVTVGGSYRSGVPVDFDGTATFTFEGTGTGLDPQLQQIFPETQGVSTEITFPTLATLAVALRENDFTLEMDLGWTQWSSFDALPLTFEDDPTLNSTVVQNWEDAWFLRVGAEWWLNSRTALRAGYYFDESPQPLPSVSPILADNSRHGLSIGLGRQLSDSFRADLFGLWLLVPDRDTEGQSRDGFNGVYANSVGILGLTLGYQY